jgi:glycosyltransferase involved in cell wall biosynthesis
MSVAMAAFPLYGDRGASSRVRLSQFLPALREAGIEVSASPFFTDAELASRQSGARTGPFTVASVYARRRATVRHAQADVYWLEKEFFPWLPFAAERGLLTSARPLILDIDDAVFHRYDQHRSAAVRALYGSKLDRLFARATLVTAGNAYLAARARAAGAAQVEVVPSVVPVSKFLRQRPRSDATFRVVWIGQPSTQHYLEGITAVLDRMATAPGTSLALIGAARAPATRLDCRLVPWRPDIEYSALAEYDVGLMPLADTPWERGKCGYKLLQYMAAGLPVVASDVGANRDIVRQGVDGFLVANETEWLDALGRLRADPELRARMGASARARVAEAYSLEAWGPQLATRILAVSGGAGVA